MKLFLSIFFIFLILFYYRRKKSKTIKKEEFPPLWKDILQEKILFYRKLDTAKKIQFEQRILLFLNTKKIEAIDTEIDDVIRIMVASSSTIPMFSFPEFDYPNLKAVLIYPNSFDEKFQTQRFNGHKEFISGMVGNRFLNGTMILSKPDLIRAFDGVNHKENVGMHEFIHLIDKLDGAVDGVPEIIVNRSNTKYWLHLIQKEKNRIEKGKSDINPYALSSDAEFFAVVSEYFFNNPKKFKRRHLELYKHLAKFFHQKP